jgi:hypothetical protein
MESRAKFPLTDDAASNRIFAHSWIVSRFRSEFVRQSLARVALSPFDTAGVLSRQI